jgi:hypothetical protein
MNDSFEKLGTCVIKFNPSSNLFNDLKVWFAERKDVIDVCFDKHDYRWAAAIANGTESTFEPQLDEQGDYLFKLTGDETNILSQAKTLRLVIDDLIGTGDLIIVSNDFMTYEIFFRWLSLNKLGAQFISYIMINNDVEEE